MVFLQDTVPRLECDLVQSVYVVYTQKSYLQFEFVLPLRDLVSIRILDEHDFHIEV